MPKFNHDTVIDETIRVTNELIGEFEETSHDPLRIQELLNDIHIFLSDLHYDTSQATHQRYDNQRNLLLGCLEDTEGFLSLHEDVIVTSADKGQVTVLMSRDMYDRKLNELIDKGIQNGTYEVVESEAHLYEEFMRNRKCIVDIVQSDVYMSRSTKERIRKIYQYQCDSLA